MERVQGAWRVDVSLGRVPRADRTKGARMAEDITPGAPPPTENEPGPPKGGALSDIPRGVLVLGVAIILAGAMVAWAVTNAAKTQKSSEEPAAPQTFTIDGSIEAPECYGGYEITNASVEVRDQTDKLIGAATTSSDVSSGVGCEASFDVEVPKATFY